MNPALPILLALYLGAEPVNLKAGDAAPFDGALMDPPTAESIRQVRLKLESDRADCVAQLVDARAAPSGGTGLLLAGSLGAALGLVVGILLGAWAVK